MEKQTQEEKKSLPIEYTAQQIFASKLYYNKWLEELKPYEVQLIIDMMEEYAEQFSNLPNEPSIDDAGVAAVRISETITPELSAKEQALFVAGFQECIKWLNKPQPLQEEGLEEELNKLHVKYPVNNHDEYTRITLQWKDAAWEIQKVWELYDKEIITKSRARELTRLIIDSEYLKQLNK